MVFYDLSHAVRADQLDISGLLNPCCILCSPHGVKLLTFPYGVKLTPFSTIDICIRAPFRNVARWNKVIGVQ